MNIEYIDKFIDQCRESVKSKKLTRRVVIDKIEELCSKEIKGQCRSEILMKLEGFLMQLDGFHPAKEPKVEETEQVIWSEKKILVDDGIEKLPIIKLDD